ncbi:MAG: energy transducer TonB [Bryobacteraceae bacterium]|jgi:TonB family protein
MIAPLLALLAVAAANQAGSAVAEKPPVPLLEEPYEPPPMPDWYPSHHVRPPVVISKVEPDYFAEARKRGVQGKVTVGLWVNTNGRPSRLRVLRSLDPELDEKALEAIRQWRFKPALKNGKPVRAPVTVEVDFRYL